MFEEPYIGMPIKLGNINNPSYKCCDNNHMESNGDLGKIALDDLPLAMSYVPIQKWNNTYPLSRALDRGTIFPELDLPFKGGMSK